MFFLALVTVATAQTAAPLELYQTVLSAMRAENPEVVLLLNRETAPRAGGGALPEQWLATLVENEMVDAVCRDRCDADDGSTVVRFGPVENVTASTASVIVHSALHREGGGVVVATHRYDLTRDASGWTVASVVLYRISSKAGARARARARDHD